MASVIPLNGEVTSWTNNTGLISGAVKPSQIVWNIAADEGDVTAFESNTMAAEYISGLRNGTGTITSFLSPATYGLQGLVTSASSANYTTNSKSWNMTIAIDESDTTAFGATGVSRPFVRAGHVSLEWAVRLQHRRHHGDHAARSSKGNTDPQVP
jgi:hypothetical protein